MCNEAKYLRAFANFALLLYTFFLLACKCLSKICRYMNAQSYKISHPPKKIGEFVIFKTLFFPKRQEEMLHMKLSNFWMKALFNNAIMYFIQWNVHFGSVSNRFGDSFGRPSLLWLLILKDVYAFFYGLVSLVFLWYFCAQVWLWNHIVIDIWYFK